VAVQGATIAMNVLVMNLEKLLELLCVLIACWQKLLLGLVAANDGHDGFVGADRLWLDDARPSRRHGSVEAPAGRVSSSGNPIWGSTTARGATWPSVASSLVGRSIDCGSLHDLTRKHT